MTMTTKSPQVWLTCGRLIQWEPMKEDLFAQPNSRTEPIDYLIVLEDLEQCFVGVELVTGIVGVNSRSRLSGNPLRDQAQIADSSQAFWLSAGTGRSERCCQDR